MKAKKEARVAYFVMKREEKKAKVRRCFLFYMINAVSIKHSKLKSSQKKNAGFRLPTYKYFFLLLFQRANLNMYSFKNIELY